MKLLNIDQNAKTVKGQKKGYMTGVMYLAPANLSGYEVCPMRSKGCTAACLNTAGRGVFSNVQKSRIAKTKLFFEDRPTFWTQLIREINNLLNKADRNGFVPCVRLNGTSDIVWEAMKDPLGKTIFDLFPNVQFYDYTKRYNRKNLPKNYHLTFSLSESNMKHAATAIENGMNVAVVFRDANFPKTFMGLNVISGDETDLRFLDPKRCIIGLKAKGKGKKDTSGFVHD